MKMKKSLIVLLLVLSSFLFLVSCGKKQTDLEKGQELRNKISDCRKFMETESGKISDKDALRKREEAQKNAKELGKLAEKSGDGAVKELSKGVDDDLAKIMYVENLVTCQQKLKDKVASLKLTTYRSGRDFVVSGIFKSLQIAVQAVSDITDDKAEKTETGKKEPVTSSLKQAADAGRTVAEFLTGNTYSDDKEGREKLAADLGSLSSKPLPELNLLLALTYLVSGQDDLALFEIEKCNPSTFQETKYLSVKDKVMFYHIIRSWILHSFGWEPLSVEETGKLEKMMAEENEMTPATDPAKRNQTLSLWHLFLAYQYGYEKNDYIKMDQHLAWLIRINPDSDLVVYLTGEKHAADGTWEKVDKSLEKDYAGTEDETTIKVLAGRIRAVRDSEKLEPPPRVITDRKFILRLAVTLANKYAVKAANSDFIRRLCVSIRDFWTTKKPEEKPEEPAKPDKQETDKPAGDETKM